MSDESSFEDVGLSDKESVVRCDKNYVKKKILFELPSSFSSSSSDIKQDHHVINKDQSNEKQSSSNQPNRQSTTCYSYSVPVARLITNLEIGTGIQSSPENSQERTSSVLMYEHTTESDAHSETSSFVPVRRTSNISVEKDDIKPASIFHSSLSDNDGDVDTNSLWSTIERSSDYDGFDSEVSWRRATYEESSVAASSTISGFDLVSISDTGQIERRCKRCTLVNENKGGVCRGCGLPLIANPNIDMDAQIAMHLHLKEEQFASFQMKPLLEQSRFFTKDILEYIQSNQLDTKNHQMEPLLANYKEGDLKELLEKLAEVEKRQKKLEKQLALVGITIAEDIEYDEARRKVQEIAKRMVEIGGSDVTFADKAGQKKLREDYIKLVQEMGRYYAALMLTEEYQSEQDRIERQWETDDEPANIEALKKIRRHMPVNIRHLTEADLTTKPSPNGKYLPKDIAKKFKRTNILQCLRISPDDLVRMHPSTLENMRITGMTLTEQRAIHQHFRLIGPKWEKNKAEKMTERKWIWYQMMKNNFKDNLTTYLRHVEQYGPPGNHPYTTRDNPNGGCPYNGKQCPLKADKLIDYDGDYGWTDDAVYEVSKDRKAQVEDSDAKAMVGAFELAKEKKANERADLLKKHYKGKLLQVSKANGSCESMDESMDSMENHIIRWIEFILDNGEDETKANKEKEIVNFTNALNEFKLRVIDFCQRSGMQMSGKKKKVW